MSGDTDPVEAVIFDCDGVLVDSEILALDMELRILAEHGMNYQPAAFRERFMGMPDDAFFAALDADSRSRRGVPLPPDFRRMHAELYDQALRERLEEVEGASLAVGRCRGVRTAVASSSTTSKLRMKLDRVGLWEVFAPHVYSGDLVDRGKPAPDLFLHVADRLETRPANCLVIEDSVNGVLAGRAAGMCVWGFLGGSHLAGNGGERLLEAGASGLLRAWSDFESVPRAGPSG